MWSFCSCSHFETLRPSSSQSTAKTPREVILENPGWLLRFGILTCIYCSWTVQVCEIGEIGDKESSVQRTSSYSERPNEAIPLSPRRPFSNWLGRTLFQSFIRSRWCPSVQMWCPNIARRHPKHPLIFCSIIARSKQSGTGWFCV